MKIIKYIILILVIFVISLFVLSRVPAIQDRVVTNVIKNVLSNPVSLPDDGLSALVCGSDLPYLHLEELKLVLSLRQVKTCM